VKFVANIKSQIKRNITNKKSQLRKASFKSSYKTTHKDGEVAVKENNKEKELSAISIAYKNLDK